MTKPLKTFDISVTVYDAITEMSDTLSFVITNSSQKAAMRIATESAEKATGLPRVALTVQERGPNWKYPADV